MLKDGFYTLQDIRCSGNDYEVDITINPEHPLFEGHFPGNPVVPGVCSIQIIKECIETIIKQRITIFGISSCKFTSMIVPDATVKTVSLTVNEGKVSASILDSGKSMLKLKANFE